MRYRFLPYELDAERFELRKGDAVLCAEPQVFSLLLFLILNRHRMVTRDDIIDSVWGGRIVSEAAVSSRIKSARRLVGDDGSAQRLIKTVHGRGFRFIAEVEEIALLRGEPAPNRQPPADPTRPSLAVLRFANAGVSSEYAIIAEALPQDIIRELSRLRWLFIISRGSSFRFDGHQPDVRHTGEALGVRYLLAGTVFVAENRLVVAVELADVRDQGVIWAERYEGGLDAVHEMRAAIVSGVAAALEVQIPIHEANHARTRSPDTLDAWSAYHLGLRNMFCFTAADNAAAVELFKLAIATEPAFARAHAGLSFTRFQEAFLGYGDRAKAVAAARDAAERAVAIDPLDPFANATMGRAHWLIGDLEGSLGWLDRSTELSPCYAQGTYSRAWAETLLSCGEEGQLHVDRAMALSPLDPLRYGMLATRALSHFVRADYAEAANWSEKAAREPGAHSLIAVIAAACLAAHGEDARARSWVDAARRRQPSVSRDGFFRSFPFVNLDVRRQITRALERSGL